MSDEYNNLPSWDILNGLMTHDKSVHGGAISQDHNRSNSGSEGPCVWIYFVIGYGKARLHILRYSPNSTGDSNSKVDVLKSSDVVRTNARINRTMVLVRRINTYKVSDILNISQERITLTCIACVVGTAVLRIMSRIVGYEIYKLEQLATPKTVEHYRSYLVCSDIMRLYADKINRIINTEYVIGLERKSYTRMKLAVDMNINLPEMTDYTVDISELLDDRYLVYTTLRDYYKLNNNMFPVIR